MPAQLLRPGAFAIDVYNSGPVVFVYDQAHAGAITEAEPSLLQGFHGDPAQDVDDALRALGDRGMLAVFALYQDDELCAELSLGPPIDDERYGAPQRTYLAVPSGALCIDSYDSLPMADGADEGARITVAPGDYVLAVQSLADDYEQDEDALVPQYYLSLAPAGSDRPQRPFMPYPAWGWSV